MVRANDGSVTEGAADSLSEAVEKVFAAIVTDIRLESRAAAQTRWHVALDRTEFLPGDVGELEAVARSGARLVVPVAEVIVEESSGVWHVVEKPLTEGTEVIARVLLPK